MISYHFFKAWPSLLAVYLRSGLSKTIIIGLKPQTLLCKILVAWMLVSSWTIILLQYVKVKHVIGALIDHDMVVGLCSKLIMRLSYYTHLGFGKSFPLTWESNPWFQLWVGNFTQSFSLDFMYQIKSRVPSNPFDLLLNIF